MDTNKDTLEIVLAGREYSVACPPDERQSLQAAVDYLDDQLRTAAEKTRSSGERLIVMTALNLAHELLTMKLPGGFDMNEFQRRIGVMEASLDKALTPQEQLF